MSQSKDNQQDQNQFQNSELNDIQLQLLLAKKNQEMNQQDLMNRSIQSNTSIIIPGDYQQNQQVPNHQKKHNQKSNNNQSQNNQSNMKYSSQIQQQMNNQSQQEIQNQNNNQNMNNMCQFHLKTYVAYCVMHKELVCEECCDLSHHKDHNNQIAILKAAAWNFISDIDYNLQQITQNRPLLMKCRDFNLRNQIRKSIIDFFNQLKNNLDNLQKQKLDEFNKIFKESNFANIKEKASDLSMRLDNLQSFYMKRKSEFDQKNYVNFLQCVQEIERMSKKSEKIIKDVNELVKEQEQQKSIELIQDRNRAELKIKQIVEQCLKVPVLVYNRDMVDTLHFFVYNTHNLFLYNFRSHSYRSYVVNIKIPANFMSVENDEGRIFLTGGGEPGRATKNCYEFVEERLIPRKDMLFERRAHTLTSVLVDRTKSQIFAIGSSLPNESMNKCEFYDVQQDNWTQLPSLNTKRNFHTTIAFECQALYVVAGFNGGQRTNLIEKIDLKRRIQWETLNLKIKENTNWICLEGCGLFQISQSHILIFGGFTTSDQKTNHCYLFNTNNNEIEQLNCKTRTQSNFYQRQPKLGLDQKIYCVETNSLDLHIFDLKQFEWDFIDRKYIGW